jgi:hypothetical protein
MTTARGEITGKKPAQTADEAKQLLGPSIADMARDPITVTVKRARELSGLSNTSIYKLIAAGKLEIRRAEGIQRTLISFSSLQSLLDRPHRTKTLPPRGRPRGRPRASAPPGQ